MKKQIKKMMRHAVFGFAMLTGIAMIGVNPASAAVNSDVHTVLKDSNGDSVVYGQKYYMEPYEYPGHKLVDRNDGGGIEDIVLKSDKHLEITFEKRWGNVVELPGDTVLIQHEVTRPLRFTQLLTVFDSSTSYYPQLMYANDLSGGYAKNSMWIPTAPSADMNPEFAVGNYFAFKNEALNVFFQYQNPNVLRNYAQVGNTMNSKTMWRVVKI
ncbi:hypothetical protein [Bacillus cereus]|uniref:Uncharacterized protein n=1 Tax=Bacillus cereus TaxID=1396 RepID=A0A2B9E5Q2_BACCE|nr:hypothetical protein [Bacillus cereus]PGM95213.1 hypothetical protein CN958_08305 [Bacillus cereus]